MVSIDGVCSACPCAAGPLWSWVGGLSPDMLPNDGHLPPSSGSRGAPVVNTRVLRLHVQTLLRGQHRVQSPHTFCACCSVTESCHMTLCDLRDCSTPGFPVLHYLLELAQTHVH